MNKYGFVITIGALALGAGVLYFRQPAYAATTGYGRGQGRGIGYTQMLEEKARILNMSTDALKNAFAQGKTMYDLAKEKGIQTDALHERMETAQKVRLQKMVDAGAMTPAQMKERLEWMETRQKNCGNNVPGSGMGRGMNRSW